MIYFSAYPHFVALLPMHSKVKFFPEHKLVLLKFARKIDVDDVLQLLTTTYERKEFAQIKFSILDLRNTVTDFEPSKLEKVIQFARQHGTQSRNVRATLLVNNPQFTAIASLFQHDIGIPGKEFSVNSTLSHTIQSLGLKLSPEELEDMFAAF